MFGKVDVTRYPEAAQKYRISTSSFSRQLPTVVLLDGGLEVTRRPGFDEKGRLVPFTFTQVSCQVTASRQRAAKWFF